MIESMSSIEENDARAIAALSEKLKVPEEEVVKVFRIELDRLSVQARIPNFLSVLAIRNTKSILHRNGCSRA
jgi:hypothetical protein